MPVTLKLTPPTLTVSSNATNMPANGIVLGGTAGRTFDPVPVQIGLNTGANVFSWTVSGAPPWLALDKNSGTVSATQQQIVLTPQRLLATPGTTTANLSFRAVVNGDTITQVVPVSFNLDTHRLIASSNGIAFTSTPNASWQRLDASVSITSNLGLPAAWTATVDNQSAWLHVGTNTGHSGDSFTLHADPTGLAPDQLYTATVTITSSDTTVAAPEVIHVGLWVGSTTPSGPTIVDNVAFNTVKADPIRPYVYAHVSGETTLRVYNLYTGQALPGITGIPDATREMTVSTDGSTLYALDSGAQTITTVDLSAGTLTGSFAAPTKVTGTSFPYDFLKYARPNGVGVVFTDVGGAFLASTGADVGIGAFGYFDITADSHKLFYNGSRLDIDFTSAGGGKVINVQHTGFADLNISAQDVATSGDGSRVYAAAGGGIRRYNGNTFVTQTPLPFGTVIPNNVEMASDGRIFTAATVSDSSNHNIWIYNAADTLVATFLAPHIIGDRRLVVSGDGLILALITGVSDPSLQIIPVGP